MGCKTICILLPLSIPERVSSRELQTACQLGDLSKPLMRVYCYCIHLWRFLSANYDSDGGRRNGKSKIRYEKDGNSEKHANVHIY